MVLSKFLSLTFFDVFDHLWPTRFSSLSTVKQPFTLGTSEEDGLKRFQHITEMTILTVQLIVEFSKNVPGFGELTISITQIDICCLLWTCGFDPSAGISLASFPSIRTQTNELHSCTERTRSPCSKRAHPRWWCWGARANTTTKPTRSSMPTTSRIPGKEDHLHL